MPNENLHHCSSSETYELGEDRPLDPSLAPTFGDVLAGRAAESGA